MADATLGLDDQFFCRIALKNSLIGTRDAEDAMAEADRRRSGGDGDASAAAVLVERGIVTGDVVARIHDAQAASQVLRLDSLYGDIALTLGWVSVPDLDDAFRAQREQRFHLRVGEYLVDRGCLSSEQHRDILKRLLRQVQDEEQQYMLHIREHGAGAGAGDGSGSGSDERGARTEEVASLPPAGVGEAIKDKSTDRFACVDPKSRRTDPERPTEEILPPEPDPAPAVPRGAATEEIPFAEILPAGPPASDASSSAPWGTETEDVPPPAGAGVRPGAGRAQPPGGAAARPPAPGPPPAGAGPAVSEESGSSTGAFEAESTPLGRFFERNVRALHEEVARAGGTIPVTGEESSLGRKKLLESAIEMRYAGYGDPQATRGESEVLIVESDIKNVENLIESGFRHFEGGRQETSSDSEVFNADEYVRRRKKEMRFVRLSVVLAVIGVAILGTGIFVKKRLAEGKVRAAREALAASDYDGAIAALEGASGLFTDATEVERIRAEASLRRSLGDARALLAAGSYDQAERSVEQTKSTFDRLPEDSRRAFAAIGAEADALLDRVRYERLLAQGRDHEVSNLLLLAVQSYTRAIPYARQDRTAEERIARIQESFLHRIGVDRQIATLDSTAMREAIGVCSEYLVIFPDDQRVASYQAQLRHRYGLFRGDDALRGAATPEDVDRAIQYYLGASQATSSAEVDHSLEWARRARSFLERRTAAHDLELQGRLDEAVETYREAVAIADQLASQVPDLAQRIPAVQAEPLRQRISECEAQRARDEVGAREQSLRERARTALRQSNWDVATAIFQQLAALRPQNEDYRRITEFLALLPGSVYVPPGPFRMGSDRDELERPLHEAAIEHGYFIDRYEVTNAQYEEFIRARGREPPPHWLRVVEQGGRTARTFDEFYDNHPVVQVTWQDARSFAAWASKRLPTETEWERAARGTDARIYPWGNEGDESRGNIHRGPNPRVRIQTEPVGSEPQDLSPAGCFDMGGNVQEWTADLLHPYPGGQGRSSETQRVIRGGSWRWEIEWARTSHRDAAEPNASYAEVGFRCARDVPDFLRPYLE